MIVLWVTLLVLHRGYSLVPVITVHVGEPVTFTCVLPRELFSSREVFWYKQNAGDTLKVMAMKRKTTKIEFVPEFSESRWKVNNAENCSNLTILSTIPEDEGMYHCELKEWINTKWSGTYLLVKGNSQRTSNYTVVQWPTLSGPVHPGDSVTLQCSVFSDPENETCPGDHSVHWFRAGAEKSHPGTIYTAQRSDECEKKPDAHSPAKSCVYRFTKSVSSSDAGTFYCAVATCGQILFGHGTQLEIDETGLWSVQKDSIILLLLCAVLAISLVVLAFIIYDIKKNKSDSCRAAGSLQENVAKRNLKVNGDTGIYSAAIFTMVKSESGGMRDAVGRDRIYTAVKAFGLN
ncbi:uncharacterized protein LOC121188131 [Toxotes jaculatrix]|uniref:uncharacterized protein LOC121188131 n=1 Tax=Toxotes jaculatrix TaxID=941984 RepID=UPI001B3AF482|nr:uncharacterized protein LOC121188131 [Toxotes jaculatrix]